VNDNVKRLAVANGPNIFQMLLVSICSAAFFRRLAQAAVAFLNMVKYNVRTELCKKKIVHFLYVIDCDVFLVSRLRRVPFPSITYLLGALINHRRAAANPASLSFRRRELLPYISTSVSSFIPRHSCRRGSCAASPRELETVG